MRPLPFLILPTLALVLAPRLAAQSSPAFPVTPRFGVTAALSLADVGGSDAGNTKARIGFMVGGNVTVPIGEYFAFAPELLFSTKGAKLDDPDFSGSAKLNYLELPLPLRFDVPVTGRTRPFLFAGPSLAFQTSCNLEGDVQSVTVTIGCEEFLRQAGEPDIDVKKFDLGALVGGGLAFDVGGRVFSIGVRYDYGFMKLFSDSDTKNRVLSFVGTFEFPFSRK